MDPKWVRVIAIAVVVIVIVAGVTVYYLRTRSGTNAAACSVHNANPLVVDQAENPDSLDPAVTFSTPGWAAVQQVYQGMVNYNATSYTTFLPVLAKNWSSSSDGFHWNFTLRPGVTFSNGDPYNAYVQWYSLYRDLVMTQASQFILGENFWYPNASYPTVNPAIQTELNSWDFLNPTAAEKNAMMWPNQSFQVINNLTIELNLGFGYLGHAPYTYLLPELSAPNSYAVDPRVIQAHGGVIAGKNDFMSTNMLGTGPYILSSTYTSSSTGYSLSPSPGFWGAKYAAKEPWNDLIQPPKERVQVSFQQSTGVTVTDLKSGAAQMASFAYTGPSTISQVQGIPCVTVQPLSTVFGSTSGGWWIYMNQSQAPFNNLSVREAVVHAINYQQIIQEAFGGAATQWVGPVPPGYPDYNPSNLPNYTYNLTLAKQEMANSPWKNGYPQTLNYEYINYQDWQTTATILKADLAAIGININPVGIDLKTLYAEQVIDPTSGTCTAQEVSSGLGPFPIGQEFYTSDYIAPDDWTQNNAVGLGSANQCMSGYNNGTVNSLVYTAAADPNPTNVSNDYAQITKLMYDNYTDAWLVVPTQYAVYNSNLHGFLENPMASSEPFTLSFQTQYMS